MPFLSLLENPPHVIYSDLDLVDLDNFYADSDIKSVDLSLIFYYEEFTSVSFISLVESKQIGKEKVKSKPRHL